MKALTNNELASFCNQLTLILKSGISVLEGFSIMMDDLPDGDGKWLMETLFYNMEETGYLHTALKSTNVFPDYMCSMVEIGEHSGRLVDVMAALTEHYRKEDELSQNIKSAITYPVVMLGMMSIVIFVLIIKVLPVFQQVFQQLGTGLTGLSGAILELGIFISRQSFVFIGIGIFLAVLSLFLTYSSKGRSYLKTFSYHFFLTRNITAKIACARFSSGMYLALNSGLDIDEGLDLARQLVEHPKVLAQISKTIQMVEAGNDLAESMRQAGIYSGIYARMISIGFKTGSLDDVMKQISFKYDDDIHTQISDIISKLEPTLVAILSIAAGMILLSVMLPLMGIMTNIG
ncbi:MAG: type II secretion system F family protein [Candidatus Ruminococcus intestinipullorum]|nr:type II secretion system F family protein [Candidatus Ruminococcus intestinipullorum]